MKFQPGQIVEIMDVTFGSRVWIGYRAQVLVPNGDTFAHYTHLKPIGPRPDGRHGSFNWLTTSLRAVEPILPATPATDHEIIEAVVEALNSTNPADIRCRLIYEALIAGGVKVD